MSKRGLRYMKMLKEHYKDAHVGVNINDIKVNRRKLEKALRREDLDTWLENTYKDLGITRYTSKEDMNLRAYKGMAVDLDKRWEEYQHREDLIMTGQYQAGREELYKRNYIAQLKNLGVDSNVISALEGLSIGEWEDLASLKASDKDNINHYEMPYIFDYYPNSDIESGIDYANEYEYEIRKAYRKVFGKFIEDKPSYEDFWKKDFVYDENNALTSSRYFYLAHNMSTDVTKVMRKFPRDLRSLVDINDDLTFTIDNKSYDIYEKEGKFALIEQLEKRGRTHIRKTKRGTEYYPFYLNKSDTQAYIAWKHNKREQ